MSSSTLSTMPRTESVSASPTPGLIVMFGASANKKLLLNRPAILVGSGAVCDIKLKTPDIGEVHALIIQTPEGLLLRDCKTATGTLVNGAKVEEIQLKNEDLLQFGTFQFKARVPDGWPPKRVTGDAPPAPTAPPPPPAPTMNGNGTHTPAPSQDMVETLEQKRRRLTQMAWARRNLTQYQAKLLEDAQLRIGQLESEQRTLKAERDEAITQGTDELTRLRTELERQRRELEEQAKAERETLAAREQALAQAQEQLQALQHEIKRQQEEAASRLHDSERLQADAQAHRQTATELTAELDKQRQDQVRQHEEWETARAERERLLLQLGEEEGLFRAELSTLRDELTRLRQEKSEAAQQQETLRNEVEQAQKRLGTIQAEETQLQELCARLREEQALANKPLEERRLYLQELEETLRKQQQEFSQQQEVWQAQKAQEEAELQKRRAEMDGLETQVRATLVELEDQKKAHAQRQVELDRGRDDLHEDQEELKRQQQAIQRETEMWLDQRNTLATEVATRQEEIDVLVNRCKELRQQETRLESSNAEWNAHLEKEQREWEQAKTRIKADAEAEARRILEKERKALDTYRDRVEKQVAHLYAQTGLHLEQCLNLIQTEKERFGELREEYTPAQNS